MFIHILIGKIESAEINLFINKMNETLCRTCLVETDGSIFKTIFLAEKQLSLVEMLNECTGLKVTESDDVSLKICDACTEEIINSYVYRKKCWDSHNFLLRRLEESKVQSEPINCEAADPTENDDVAPILLDIIREDMDDSILNETEVTDLEGAVNCELCDKIYPRRKLMLKHLRKDHNILEYEKYECKYCEKLLSSLRNLRRHIATLHELAEEGDGSKFVCHLCGQIAKNRRNLILHVRRHTGEKPYKCDLCDYRAARDTDIASHKRTHTNERPFKCDICGKLFRTSSARAYHRKSHSEEMPSECIVCLKKFKHMSIYKKHMIIHDPDKYIACKFCGKKFARKYNLNIHMKQHTDEKPHICEFCGKGFIQKRCWKTHMKNNHNQ